MRRALLAFLALLAAVPAMVVRGAGGEAGSLPVAGSEQDAAAIYALNCSVCHGPTGGGLAEAVLAFPPDERNCSRCHKANNPVVQPLTQPFIDNDMFPIGDPPALHVEALQAGPAGDAAVQALPMAWVASPVALFNYVRATMPRYDPGRQTDAEYWLLTAHLLRMNDRADDAALADANAVAAGWVAGD
ncbi:MAG: hypothetical protein WDA03_00700 [Trueperaceae bacterium]|jgi:mono/diheme cytochrome c family protein